MASGVSVDVVDHQLRTDAEIDHQLAQQRGQRIRAVARRVAWELFAQGRLIGSQHDCERELIQALAEHLYHGCAVDI